MKLAARLRRHPRLSLVLLLCLSAGLFWLQHPHTASPAESAPDLNEQAALTVSVIQPRHHSWPQRLTANGNITAWQEASVGSEIGGLRLTELHIDIGDHVTRGQLLARLEDRTVQAELAQTQANLDEASVALQEATANAQRARRVRGKGTLSEQQTTAYLIAEQAARARVSGLRAALQSARVRLEQTRITAPDAGTITARQATLGAVVQSGDELFRLIREDRLEWRAELPAAELSRVTPGMPVSLKTTGGQQLTGQVRRISPTLDANSRNGVVYVNLPKPGGARAGMFAQGEIELGQRQVLTVPQSALLLRDGFHYLFRLDAGDLLVQSKVQLGQRRGQEVAIEAGLGDEARIVDSGVGFLNDGDRVRVVHSTNAATGG